MHYYALNFSRMADQMTSRFLCEINHSNDRFHDRFKFAVKNLNDIAYRKTIAKTAFFSILIQFNFFNSLTAKHPPDDQSEK